MSDLLNITPASLNQAYRGYAVEQGNDSTRAIAKLNEAADGIQSSRELSAANAVDAVFISPEAARLFAEQTRRVKTVVSRSDADKSTEGGHSATANADRGTEETDVSQSEDSPRVTGQGVRVNRDTSL